MYRIILFFVLMIFLNANAQEPIQLGIKYNEASARVEAFKDVERKIDKEFYKKHLKDKNRKENIEAIKNSSFEFETRMLCPFYLKKTLASYAVIYKEDLKQGFYYNILGSLIKFDIATEQTYPRKVYGYSRFGNLISVAFEVSENEQFIYDENGKLIAHWLDDVAFNKDNKTPKVMKLQRGIMKD